QHLERGGFASTVRAQKANQFPFLDLESDVVNGSDGFVAPVEQALHRPTQAGVLLVGAKSFSEAVRLDGRHAAQRSGADGAEEASSLVVASGLCWQSEGATELWQLEANPKRRRTSLAAAV